MAPKLSNKCEAAKIYGYETIPKDWSPYANGEHVLVTQNNSSDNAEAWEEVTSAGTVDEYGNYKDEDGGAWEFMMPHDEDYDGADDSITCIALPAHDYLTTKIPPGTPMWVWDDLDEPEDGCVRTLNGKVDNMGRYIEDPREHGTPLGWLYAADRNALVRACMESSVELMDDYVRRKEARNG